MVNEAILKKIKTNIRISHSALDGDLSDSIAACLADLARLGVAVDLSDPLILSAIKLWCKADCCDDTAKAADYLARYERLASTLESSSDYRLQVSGDE